MNYLLPPLIQFFKGLFFLKFTNKGCKKYKKKLKRKVLKDDEKL